MELKDILTLMDRFDKSSITELSLKKESVELHLQKKSQVVAQEGFVSVPVVSQPVPTPVSIAQTGTNVEEQGSVLKSPLVGIYYESASPEAPPFKKPGDPVKVGEVVCILEAMKVFNEVKSPWNGIVTSILVSNQDIVEFDQPLMIIERT